MPYDPRNDDGLPPWDEKYHGELLQKLQQHPMPDMLDPEMQEYLIRGKALNQFGGQMQGYDEDTLHEIMQSPWFRKQMENRQKLMKLNQMLRSKEGLVGI
jgi:hypothetical protein